MTKATLDSLQKKLKKKTAAISRLSARVEKSESEIAALNLELAEEKKRADSLDQLWFEIHDSLQGHWDENEQTIVSQSAILEAIDSLKASDNKLKVSLSILKAILPHGKYCGLNELIKDIK